jgi:threonine aldolase
MAARLSDGLAAGGLPAVWPVEANEIFVVLPRPLRERLEGAGASFYPWITESLPAALKVAQDASLVRLVTSFATSAADVDRFVATACAQ